MRPGDLLVRAIIEHPVVSAVLLVALLGAFYSVVQIIRGGKWPSS